MFKNLKQDWFSNVRNDLLAGLFVALALIMGAFNRSWLHNLLHRSPATAVLRSATVPTLLLR